MEDIQHSPCGKTCREHSAATKEETSSPSSRRLPKPRGALGLMYLNLKKSRESCNGAKTAASWETVGRLPGECWTLNIGECPKDASESTLWQILQADAPRKYYLSARACEGILRRAERRGKELPKILREALEEAIALGV